MLLRLLVNIKQNCAVHTTEYYLEIKWKSDDVLLYTIWGNLETMILTERSQTKSVHQYNCICIKL